MKRTHVAGLVDVIKVEEPAEIRAVLSNRQLDRRFSGRWPLMNGLLVSKIIGALSLGGRRFPTLRARDDQERSARQDALWAQLNARAASLTFGHADVAALARWVQGTGTDTEIGVLTQQAVGRLFSESYSADVTSWEAALTLNQAPQAKGLNALLPRHKRSVRAAKELLASKVSGDLAGVHGTGIALHNLVKGFHRMRELYQDLSRRREWNADRAAQECLFAPVVVLRQATGDGEQAGCPYGKNAVFLLELRKAQARGCAMDMVFLEDAWSRCPAEKWVPALLKSVWTRLTDDASSRRVDDAIESVGGDQESARSGSMSRR